jgi:KUP system potassium uptake protein
MTSEPVDVDRSNPATKATSWAALSALGVVFGDLGTSPLYTLQTVVQAAGGRFSTESALGILSLIFWTLIITISIKYCLFVMRADNRGEGGILALMSLVGANSFARGVKFLSGMGLLGAALIYGDGAITPAISVLSALEGVNVVTTSFKPFVMPTAVLILILLFLAQRVGTEKIGRAFGPVMLLWFAVIALLGALAIVRQPAVLAAIDPSHAVRFLAHSGGTGLLVLGGVFLCITGGEALYADMGHFGKGPIRWSWYVIVLPALLLSYAGQTAYLIEKGTVTGNPFYEMAPAWSIYPLVALATVATIIASQAIITGSFSMTRQAVQLGWLPGVAIRQTSDAVYGQIYVPIVNWLMMIATVGITIGFGSSDRLAGAYGTAVATTMLLTTGLLYVAMRRVWRWPLAITLPVAGPVPIRRCGLLRRQFVEDRRRRLAAADVRSAAVHGDADVARRHRCGQGVALASAPDRRAVPARFGVRQDSARRRHDGLSDEEHAQGIAPDHGPRAFHGRLAAACHQPQRRIRRYAARRGAELHGRISGAEGWWQVVAQFGFVEIPDLRRALRQVQGLDRRSISIMRCSSLRAI